MDTLARQVIDRLEQAAQLYHRLILLVGPSGSGKSYTLRQLHDKLAFPLVNVNLELTRRLLELTEKQRAIRCGQILGEILEQAGGEVVLLDNLEIIFDPLLSQDPLRLLQQLSRNRTVVASWAGRVDGEYLVYAVPEHPEYRRYTASSLVVVAASPVE